MGSNQLGLVRVIVTKKGGQADKRCDLYQLDRGRTGHDIDLVTAHFTLDPWVSQIPGS